MPALSHILIHKLSEKTYQFTIPLKIIMFKILKVLTSETFHCNSVFMYIVNFTWRFLMDLYVDIIYLKKSVYMYVSRFNIFRTS